MRPTGVRAFPAARLASPGSTTSGSRRAARPVALGDFFHRLRAGDAGVVDQDVDGPTRSSPVRTRRATSLAEETSPARWLSAARIDGSPFDRFGFRRAAPIIDDHAGSASASARAMARPIPRLDPSPVRFFR